MIEHCLSVMHRHFAKYQGMQKYDLHIIFEYHLNTRYASTLLKHIKRCYTDIFECLALTLLQHNYEKML